jgi:hypothetical protein
MRKIVAKNFIGLFFAVLGTAIFSFAPMLAKAESTPPPPSGSGDSVNVNFQATPLFNEANFLPGNEVVRWVEVKNKTNQILPIGARAIVSSPACSGSNCLADKLNLTIKDGTTILYGPFSLAKFFSDGEIKIDDLGKGATKRYDFSIVFLPESGDDYQNSTINFDLKVGALGAEVIGDEITPGEDSGGSGVVGGGSTSTGGGSGATGIFIPDLTITQEQATTPTGGVTSVITWKTNHNATSRVIYSSASEHLAFDLNNLPDYGYAHSTLEYDAPASINGLMNHSISISGLAPNTTYYYRCVSHGSFAVSTEHSFTTLAENEASANNRGTDENGAPIIGLIVNSPEEGLSGGSALDPGTEGQELTTGASSDASLVETDNGKPVNLNNLLAGLVNLFSVENLWWLILLAIIISLFLFWLFWAEKKKKEEKRKKIL